MLHVLIDFLPLGRARDPNVSPDSVCHPVHSLANPFISSFLPFSVFACIDSSPWFFPSDPFTSRARFHILQWGACLYEFSLLWLVSSLVVPYAALLALPLAMLTLTHLDVVLIPPSEWSIQRFWCAISCDLLLPFQGTVCSVVALPLPIFQSGITHSYIRFYLLKVV